MCSLREQLLADGEYFKHMLSMVPGGQCNNVENDASQTDSSRSTSSEFGVVTVINFEHSYRRFILFFRLVQIAL